MNFDTLLAAVEREAAQYETTAKAVLFTHDGRPILAPDEHEAQQERLLQPVRAAVAAVHEAAQLAQQQAAIAATAIDDDPLASVPTGELQRMAALKPFVEDEIEAMDIASLQKRLLWAVNHADAPTKRLYLRLAGKRVKEMGGERLVQPLRNLEDTLVNPAQRAKRAKALEAANELRHKAQQASFAANDRLLQADGRAAKANADRIRAYGGKL